MSVRIPHRFIDRLQWQEDPRGLQVIILGSFNPGEPDMAALHEDYRTELNILFSTRKYQRFKQVRNFYDRPQNRLWGVMDRIRVPAIYDQHGQKFKNRDGLKFFRGGDRDAVLLRQQKFCRKNGIFISDVVTAIATTDFKSVYNDFSDAVVDKWAIEFNTDHLLEILDANQAAQVLFNVKESRTTPAINQQLALLKAAAGPNRSHWPPSTSGAAANRYEDLVLHWKEVLRLQALSL